MKHKLITSVVVAAINVYVATLAHAACPLDGSTPIRSGPLNPINGFAETVTDSAGVALQECTDPDFCFLSPVVPGNTFSQQIGSGIEMFYWSAGAKLTVPGVVGNPQATGMRLVLTMATEAAFLSAVPIDGQQIEFARLRIAFNAQDAGVYTLTHPYGQETMVVDVNQKGRDIFFTFDRSFAPNSTFQGRVGPWLKWDPAVAPAAPTKVRPDGTIQQFLGDGSPAGPTHTVVGSPCGTNFVTLSAQPLNAGDPAINLDGAGHNFITTDQFNVSGMVFDGKFQTPLSSNRTTYSRLPGQIGQIDAFAISSPTATVTVADGPSIPLGTSRLPVPATLGSDGLGVFSNSNILTVGPNTTDLPPLLALTATNPVGNVATPASDPSTFLVPLVDFVKIGVADFDPVTNILTVAATSGDTRVPPTLTVREYNTAVGTPIVTTAPPGIVTVLSSAGGSDTAKVRVVQATPPAAPTGLASTTAALTSHTVTLTWTDNSTNESAFDIYRDGVKIASAAANATTFTDTGLAPSSTHTYQVFAVNTAGQAGSNIISATTLALPLPASGVAATLGTTRVINVSWVDNATDETGYVISRATTAAGPYTQVGTAPAGTGTLRFADTIAAPVTGASTYFYQVVAVRGPDASTAAVSAAGLATPALPTAAGTPAKGAVTPTSVVVNWADGVGETAYQLLRSTSATGTFANVGASLPANTITATDGTVVGGTTYFYRVDSTNWAGLTSSPVSLGVAVPLAVNLSAPTGVRATITAGRQPVALAWTNTATGAANNRVQRIPQTVTSLTGALTSGAVTNLTTTLAATATAFNDPAPVLGTLYRYDVTPTTATQTGTPGSVYAIPGGFAATNLKVSTGAATGQISVTWTSPGASVAKYTVERCATSGTTCASFNAPVTLASNAVSTTLTGTTKLTYVVRLTAFSGTVPGAAAPFATSVLTASGAAR
jgi:hypothetical protein